MRVCPERKTRGTALRSLMPSGVRWRAGRRSPSRGGPGRGSVAGVLLPEEIANEGFGRTAFVHQVAGEGRGLVEHAQGHHGDAQGEAWEETLEQPRRADRAASEEPAGEWLARDGGGSPAHASNKFEVAAMPINVRVLAHDALGSPAVADLLGHERREARLVGVIDTHRGPVSDAEARLFGEQAKLGVAGAPDAVVEADAFENRAANREIARVALDAITGPEAAVLGLVAELDGARDGGAGGAAGETLDDAGTRLIEGAHSLFDPAVPNQAVRIGEQDNVAAGLLEGCVAGGVGAGPGLIEDTETGFAGAQLCLELGKRAIVDDNDLVIDQPFEGSSQGVETGEDSRVVLDRDDDRSEQRRDSSSGVRPSRTHRA